MQRRSVPHHTPTTAVFPVVIALLLCACSNGGTGSGDDAVAAVTGTGRNAGGRDATAAASRPPSQAPSNRGADTGAAADTGALMAEKPATQAPESAMAAGMGAASSGRWTSVSIDNADAVAGTRVIALADTIAQVVLDPPTQGTLLLTAPGHALHESTSTVRAMCNGASTHRNVAAPGTYDSITRTFDVTAALARFRGCNGELEGTVTVSGKLGDAPASIPTYRIWFSHLRYLAPSYELTMNGSIDYSVIGANQYRVTLNISYRDSSDRQYRADNLALHFTDRGFNDTVSITGRLQGPHRSYHVSTVQPVALSASAMYPRQGMLLFTAEDDSKIAVLYQSPTHYEIWVDGGDGDSALLEKSAGCTWSGGCSALN
jgi:hypothetical protein